MRIGGYSAKAENFRPSFFGGMYLGPVQVIEGENDVAFSGEFGEVIRYWQDAAGEGQYTEFVLHIWQNGPIYISGVAVERDEWVWASLGEKDLGHLVALLGAKPDLEIEGMTDLFICCPIWTRRLIVAAQGDSVTAVEIGQSAQGDFDFLNPLKVGRQCTRRGLEFFGVEPDDNED